MVSEMKTSRKRKCREDEDIGEMSLGEFMQKGLGSDSDEETAPKKAKKGKKLKKTPKEKSSENGTSKKLKTTREAETQPKKKREKASKKSAPPAEQASAKKSKTKKAPEALSFDSESENSSGSEAEFVDDIDDIQSDDEVIAKPRLEAASEVADADEDELKGIELSDEDDDEILDENVQILTEKSLRHLLEQMKVKPDTNQVKRLTEMFTGAVSEAAGDRAKTKYSVRGQGLFNAVVLACLQDLLPAVHKVMKLPPPVVPKDGSKMIDPTKGHCWKKIKNPISLYMVDLLKLLGCITQQKLQLSLLRHLLLLLPFVRARPQVEKRVLKCLSRLWSTGEESVRVVSFLCLIRLIRSGDDATFQDVLKQMYLSYVANCKFTSPQTWPLISFMRRSLVEAYALRPNIAYQHSFLYIRQLAITLRTALTVKKKDSHKSVYNWQFVHSTLLWCHLLATVRTKAMEPLIYPVVQVVTGVLNLIPSEKYIPLRLHVIRGVIELSTETTTFMPILPMLVATLKLVRWDQKPKVISMKPMNLSCALRVSDKQVKESAFRDAVIESFQEMALGYLAGISHLLSFPEVVVASCIELKKIKLKVIKHQTTVKQLLEKMNENSKFIESTREKAGLAIKELEKVAALELQLRGTTPLCTYLEKFEKLREQKLREANEDVLENYDSDEDKKAKKKSKKASKEEGDENDEEENQVDEEMETEAETNASDPRGIGKLDSDLDTDEEGDDEVGFEVADDDDDEDEEGDEDDDDDDD